jgi:hypothetical protein
MKTATQENMSGDITFTLNDLQRARKHQISITARPMLQDLFSME